MTPPTKQINVRIPWELHLQLANHKARTGQDKSEVIRRGIEMVLSGHVPHPAADLAHEVATLRTQRAENEEISERIADLHPSPDDLNGAGSPRLSPPSAAPAPEVNLVHLPAWLQGKTGMPRSIMRRRVVGGAVTIDGEPCRELDVDPALLRGDVRLEGQPV